MGGVDEGGNDRPVSPAGGDRVEVGDPLADIITDKVDVSLESPYVGVITEILVLPDETVPVGTRLAVIESGVEA